MAKFRTAESVTSGHPDKICDQISDAILDAYLTADPLSRVAVETFGSRNLIVIAGEVASNGEVDAKKVALSVYKDIGYTNNPDVIVNIIKQSPDISKGVDTGGAGDQGIMYGYATDETLELLPVPVVYAHRLASKLEELRKHNDSFNWLGPDGKTQITTNGSDVVTALVSCQHKVSISQAEISQALIRDLIKPILGDGGYDVLVNPTGTFVLGGFEADTGLTGRKIMVDTYGGLIPHGGGCFSGKDPTKVDRSGAYMARFVARNIVANNYASKCLVSIAYAIGKRDPLMVEVETYGTGDDSAIRKKILQNFDFTPGGIITALDLRRPIYRPTAAYGHFGNKDFPWEKLVNF